ncbi:MAG: AAA family ATPase, partial [Chitinophagia bacterium]|nr:AAA family ATPase [Chitinophagia bacterium]
RRFAMEDSRGFLSTYPKGAILYEVKRTPEIFSYFQEILDALEGGSQYLGWMIP